MNTSRVKNFIFEQKCVPWKIRKGIREFRRNVVIRSNAMSDISRVLISRNKKIYSFDVFDTVITRKVAQPEGIFRLLQKELQKPDIDIPIRLRAQFFEARKMAEKVARKKGRHEEVTLAEIYEALGAEYGLSSTTVEMIKILEVELESKNLLGIQPVVKFISKCREKGARIIFVSDMYLPASFIQGILERVGAYRNGDGLYVSSEHKITKHTGKLFKQVLLSEGCRPDEIMHIGDNYQSDGMSAESVGIESRLFREAIPNRYEQINTYKDLESNLYQDQINGAMRLARLKISDSDMRDKQLYNLGINVGGGIIVSYVSWLLRRAHKLKIKRLYFIARDGQILLEVAKRLNKKLNYDIDLRYLYGSRQSWFFPAMQEIDNYNLVWILTDRSLYISLRMIASKLHIKPECLQKEYCKRYKTNLNVDQKLSLDEVNRVRGVIQNNPLKQLILSQVKEYRSSAVSYFKQEGLFDSIKWGMVDIGWLGRLQLSLQSILESAGCQNMPVSAFYFGLRGDMNSKNTEKIYRETYLFDVNDYTKELSRIFEMGFINILESFIAADHGTTLGYVQRDMRWGPKLKESVNHRVLNWGLLSVRKGVYQLIDELSQEAILEMGMKNTNTKKQILEVIKRITSDPTFNEAVIIGDHPFNADQSETYKTILAPPFNFVKMFYNAFTKSWHNDDKEKLTFWHDGSLKRRTAFAGIISNRRTLSIISKIGNIFYRRMGVYKNGYK